jgi:capsular polysaccharide biosynthesis protein
MMGRQALGGDHGEAQGWGAWIVKRSYAETFFRHRLILTAPVLIALVLAAAYGLKQPRSYVASATMWTDRRIPNDTAIGTLPGSDVPSAGQQSLLTSLLTTRAFMKAVAMDSPLAGQTRGPQLEVDLALARLASTVSVATPGPQVMAIAVKQPSPELAVGVAAAVVRQFLKEEDRRIHARAAAQVSYDKQQLTAAGKQVREAQFALASYTAAHPGAAGSGQTLGQTSGQTSGQPQSQTDSAENTLVGQLALAQAHYADAEKSYNQSNAAMTQGNTAALEVVDPPNQAFPQSRKKIVIFSGVGGLLGGLSISVLALLLFVARDRAVRQEQDLQQTLGLRVVGTIGEFTRRRRLPFPGRSAEPVSALPEGSS